MSAANNQLVPTAGSAPQVNALVTTGAKSSPSAQRGGKQNGKNNNKSAKFAITNGAPSGGIQVGPGGQQSTGKQSPMQTATIPLEGFSDLDLSMHKTDIIPTFTTDVNPFIELIDAEYARVSARHSVSNKTLPYALFRYFCLQLWHHRSLSLAKANGQILDTDEKNFLSSFESGGDYAIPTHIAQYLSNMGNFISGGETFIYKRLDAKFSGVATNQCVTTGWLDCGNASARVTTGSQFWAYVQTAVPAVFTLAILNEMRGNNPYHDKVQLDLSHVAPESTEAAVWAQTDNISGWRNAPHRYSHSSHLNIYSNLGWTYDSAPADAATCFNFHAPSMRWVSDAFSALTSVKTYSLKQATASVMGAPFQVSWLQCPKTHFCYDTPEYLMTEKPTLRASGQSIMSVFSRFGLDSTSSTPAFIFAYRLNRDKVITGYNDAGPVYAQRSNHQPWILRTARDGGGYTIHDPPAHLMSHINRTWEFGSSSSINIPRFQSSALSRNDSIINSILLH